MQINGITVYRFVRNPQGDKLQADFEFLTRIVILLEYNKDIGYIYLYYYSPLTVMQCL